MKPEAYSAIIESPALRKRITNTPETLAFVPEVEKKITSFEQTDFQEGKGKGSKKEMTTQPAVDLKRESRIQKWKEKIYGEKISPLEWTLTGLAVGFALAGAVFVGLAAWQAILGSASLMALLSHKIFGFSIAGIVVSQIKSYGKKFLFWGGKKLGLVTLERYNRFREKMRQDKEEREEARKRTREEKRNKKK